MRFLLTNLNKYLFLKLTAPKKKRSKLRYFNLLKLKKFNNFKFQNFFSRRVILLLRPCHVKHLPVKNPSFFI